MKTPSIAKGCSVSLFVQDRKIDSIHILCEDASRKRTLLAVDPSIPEDSRIVQSEGNSPVFVLSRCSVAMQPGKNKIYTDIREKDTGEADNGE